VPLGSGSSSITTVVDPGGTGGAFPPPREDEPLLGDDLDEPAGRDLAAGHPDLEDAAGPRVDLAAEALP
jgi:hypothetical protein